MERYMFTMLMHGEKLQRLNEPSLLTIDAVEARMVCLVGYRVRIRSFRKFIGSSFGWTGF